MGREGSSGALSMQASRACERAGLRGGWARTAGAALALTLLAWAGTLTFSDAPALAATGHKFLSQLSQAPPGTPLSEPEVAAVDKEGDVFVADAGRGVVDVFSSSGVFMTQFGGGVLTGKVRGLAVDEASGEVYVADSGTDLVDVFKPSGSGGYELLSKWIGANTPSIVFGEVAGVAVNSSAGEVYVVDSSGSVVDVFKAHPKGAEEAEEGEFLTTLKGKPALEEPNGVAVNSATGQVYVADGLLENVEVFSSSGAFERKLNGKGTPTKAFGPVGVAVEAATGDMYVADATLNVVDQFNSAGEWIGWLTTAAGHPLGEPRGVAVAPAGPPNAGEVYLADAERGLVDVYGPSTTVPSVKTGKASSIKRGAAPTWTATLNGGINPEGAEAKYRFEYAEAEKFTETGEYTASTPVTSAGSGTAEVKEKAVIEGLKTETAYDYRIVGEDENGVSYGANVEFETPPAVTGLTTGAASNIQPSSATLSGSLEPEGKKRTTTSNTARPPPTGRRARSPNQKSQSPKSPRWKRA